MDLRAASTNTGQGSSRLTTMLRKRAVLLGKSLPAKQTNVICRQVASLASSRQLTHQPPVSPSLSGSPRLASVRSVAPRRGFNRGRPPRGWRGVLGAGQWAMAESKVVGRKWSMTRERFRGHEGGTWVHCWMYSFLTRCIRCHTVGTTHPSTHQRQCAWHSFSAAFVQRGANFTGLAGPPYSCSTGGWPAPPLPASTDRLGAQLACDLPLTI